MTETVIDMEREVVELGARLAREFAPRAAFYDRENRFPFENFQALHESGYLALTVPREYGGAGANAVELALAQEQLAQGDGATALAATMHLGIIGRLAETRLWPEAVFSGLCRDIVEHGALINSAHSEPTLGSPSRGGLPSTVAKRTADGWLINGHKSWTSLAPALTYMDVLAAITEPGEAPRRGNLLVRAGAPGIRIEETWDNLGMRSTASHDVIFENVLVPLDALLQPEGSESPGDGKAWGPAASGAVFLGIATAARDFAVQYAKERTPNGMSEPIAQLQTVQHRVAAMELELLQARTLFYDVIRRWQANPDVREAMSWQLAAIKYTVSQHSIRIGEIALRVVGSAGLSRSRPLERYFRDLQVSIGQPPIDDAALTIIGKAALGL